MISIIGYYGENYGDLLMLRNLIAQFPHTAITVLTYGDAQKLALQDFIKENKIKIIDLNRKITFSLLKALCNSKALIWGGGTCFMDESGTGGIKYMLLARIFNIKIKLIYLGIGIDNHNKLKTKSILALAGIISNFIFCRDKNSISIQKKYTPLNKKKVKYIPDLAFLSHPKTPSLKRKHVVFCSRDLSLYKELPQNIEEEILKFSDNFFKELQATEVYLLNADPAVDKLATHNAKEFFMHKGYTTKIIEGSNLDLADEVISSCCHLITVRLHPAVTAAQNNVPFSIYNYSDKNRKFCEQINPTALIKNFNFKKHLSEITVADTQELIAFKEAARDALKKINIS